MAVAAQKREPLLTNVFGFVDGLSLQIFQPGDVNEQNAYYNGWLTGTYVSQVLVFLPNWTVAWASYNNLGSWHDSRTTGTLYTLLSDEARTPAPFSILADSAFPYGEEVAGPILSKRKKNIDAKEQDGLKHEYWAAIIRRRQAAEWGMRVVQGAFGRRLDLRLPCHEHKRVLNLHVICTTS